MIVITNDFIIKLSNIVYDTVKHYTTGDVYKDKNLKDYNMWKDVIIERTLILIQKEL
jgi:hypothetical protein